MKARKYAKEVHLLLTPDEVDYLMHVLDKTGTGYTKSGEPISVKLTEIKKRLDADLPEWKHRGVLIPSTREPHEATVRIGENRCTICGDLVEKAI